LISESYDIEEFFRNVKPADLHDLVYTAEREATSAERTLYYSKPHLEVSYKRRREYAEALKAFIAYIQYSVKLKISGNLLILFQTAEQSLIQKRQL